MTFFCRYSIYLFVLIFLYNECKAQGSLRGSVQDASSSYGLSQAIIQIKDHQTNNLRFELYSDSSGLFVLDSIPEGIYDVECRINQYVSQKIVGFTTKNNVNKLAYFRLRRGNTRETDVIYTYASLAAQLQRPVTTASIETDAQADAPATIYVITAEDIERRGYTSLAEILEDIPEIEIQDRASYYTYNLLSIRGVQGSKKLIVLMDGVRISSFTAAELVLDKNISIRYAQQVEVLLGPAAALYGSDAVTGVINIITKKTTENQVQASLSYGSYNTSNNALSVGIAKGDFSISASANAYLSQEPKLPRFYRPDFDWYWNRYQQTGAMSVLGDTTITTFPIKPYATPRYAYSANAKIAYKQWELGFQRNWQQHSLAVSSQSALTLAWREYATASSVTNVYLSHHARPKNSKWGLSSLLNWNWYELSPKTHFADSYNDYQTVYSYTFNHTWQINEIFSYNINNHNKIQIGLVGNFTHELPNGGRILPIQWQRGKGAEIMPMQYYLGTKTVWQDGRDTQITQNIGYVNQLDLGFFFQYKLNFKDKFFLTAGARFDYFIRREKQYPAFNPRLGVVYKPHADWSIKAFYGESFIAPALENLYSDYTGIEPVLDSISGRATGYTSSYAFMPNSQLVPEKMRTGELGVLFAKSNWVVGINGYVNFLSNALTLQAILDTSYLNIPVEYAEQYTNGAALLSYGGTAQIRYKLPFGKENEGEFGFSAAYSYSGGYTKDIDDTQSLLPYSAAHTAKGNLFFRYKGFHFNLRVIYRSRTYDEGIYDEQDNFIRRSNPPFALLNLHTFYRVMKADNKRPAMDIFVKIRNLTDARYYNAAINYNDTMYASPQDPIRISGGISFSFGN